MSLNVSMNTNGGHLADIKVTRVETGEDGYHTYTWEWGINMDGVYHQMDDGKLQHREIDGAMALLAKVIEKIRGRKATA